MRPDHSGTDVSYAAPTDDALFSPTSRGDDTEELAQTQACPPLLRRTSISGRFQPVIGETDDLDTAKVKRLVICSGKVYFDLLEERRLRNIDDVAIVRLEQIHPFPNKILRNQVEGYINATQVVWCQEEPKNQGCWYQISYYLRRMLNDNQELSYVGREGSPSPAVGYYKLHAHQQTELVNQALTVA